MSLINPLGFPLQQVGGITGQRQLIQSGAFADPAQIALAGGLQIGGQLGIQTLGGQALGGQLIGPQQIGNISSGLVGQPAAYYAGYPQPGQPYPSPYGQQPFGFSQIMGQLMAMVLQLLQAVLQQRGLLPPKSNPGYPQASGPSGSGTSGGASGSNNSGNAGNAGDAGNSGGAGNAGNTGNSSGTANPADPYNPGTTPGTPTNPGNSADPYKPSDPSNPSDPYNPADPYKPGAPGDATPIPKDLDFRKLDNQQRTELGLNDRDRAVLHLWGRQMIAEGKQNGAILNTVLNAANKGQGSETVLIKQAEVDLANELKAKDQVRDGGITGRSLDEEFFKVYQKITGKDVSGRYTNRPVEFANGREAQLPNQFDVDTPEWERALERQNGLNGFENSVLRLWGHDPLFNGGQINGAILPYTLTSNSSLDKGLNKGDVRVLLDADLASDGVLNGDSLEDGFVDVLDKLYLKQNGTSQEEIRQNSLTKAQQLGRTAQQVAQSLGEGVQSALQTAKEHPIITSASLGGLMAATTVCPYLGGLGAAGVAAGFSRGLLQNGPKGL